MSTLDGSLVRYSLDDISLSGGRTLDISNAASEKSVRAAKQPAAGPENRLLRCVRICGYLISVLAVWAMVAPRLISGVDITSRPLADFDVSCLLYLIPLIIHASAVLAFTCRSPAATASYGVDADGPVFLRLLSLVCMVIAVPALVSRVVALRAYCQLNTVINTEALSTTLQACSDIRIANAAIVAVVYACTGAIMVQALAQLEAAARPESHHKSAQPLGRLQARDVSSRMEDGLAFACVGVNGKKSGGGAERGTERGAERGGKRGHHKSRSLGAISTVTTQML